MYCLMGTELKQPVFCGPSHFVQVKSGRTSVERDIVDAKVLIESLTAQVVQLTADVQFKQEEEQVG